MKVVGGEEGCVSKDEEMSGLMRFVVRCFSVIYDFAGKGIHISLLA